MMYTLSDVLRESGLSYQTLVKYIGMGLLPKPQRVWKGRKGSESLYPDDILDRIRDIQELKARGRTLTQIKDELPFFTSNQEFMISKDGRLNELEIPELGAFMDAIADFRLKERIEQKNPGYTLDSAIIEPIQKDGKDFYSIKVRVKPREQ